MTRPSLAQHEKEIALLNQARDHADEHNQAMLIAIKELRDEVKILRDHVDRKFDAVGQRQNEFDTRIKVAAGTVRGVSIGWAAAFTFLGGGIVAAITNIKGLFE